MSSGCKKAKGLGDAHDWFVQKASTRKVDGIEKKKKCKNCGKIEKWIEPIKNSQWMGKGIKETPLDTIAGQPVKGTAIVVGRGIRGAARLVAKGVKKASGS